MLNTCLTSSLADAMDAEDTFLVKVNKDLRVSK